MNLTHSLMKIINKLAIVLCAGIALISMSNKMQFTDNVYASEQPTIKLPEGVSQGPSVEGITEYRLTNGLKVILFPDASKATATVNMTYLVGSRQENYGETGMAHLLEHLMFKGSKNYPDPTKEFTTRGFRMNGSTWLDRTNYYVSFSANEDNLTWALGWAADAMTNSFIAKKDLDSEMTVVRNEYEMGENSPISVMMKRMQSVIYDWHNYGKNTIGNRSDIENVKIENLQNFYHRYYRPDNAVLTVSGKFDIQKTLDSIAADFGKIKNPEEKLPEEWTVEPTADGERYFEVRRKGETQLVAVAYRVPSALHPEMFGLEAAVDVLSDTPNGRLYENLVKTGLATQVYGHVIEAKYPGYAIFFAVVKKGESIEKVKNVLIETIETSLKKSPMTEKELDRTKQEEETAFEHVFSDPEAFAIGLSEYIALGDWRLVFYERDQTKKITTEQAGQAAEKYFVRDNRVVGVFIPDDEPKRAEIPAAPTVEELLANYQPKQEASQAEAFDASYDNLNARTTRFTVGDLKVALLPKKSRSETVTVNVNFQVGNEKNLFNKSTVSAVSSAMLTRGTKDMDRGQIEDEMTKLKMTGGLNSYVTNKSNLDKTLELVANLYKNSVFPESEFSQLQKQMVVMLESRKDKPEALAEEAMGQHFNTYPKGDVRYSKTIQENLDEMSKLKVEEVREFAKEFLGTSRGEISIVGDFDSTTAEESIKNLFPGFKSKAQYGRIIREYKPVSAARIVINTPEKENAVIFARSVFPINDEAEDAPALSVANWILGGGSGLSNRIIDRLRQKEGLSYGAGSAVRIPTFGNNGMFLVRAIVAPQNLLKAEDSLKDVIATAVKDGFTDSEVEEAKKGILQSREVLRAQDKFLSAAWVKMLDCDRDWNFSKVQQEKIEKLTANQVNAALRKYIRPGEITYVLAGDMNKSGQK